MLKCFCPAKINLFLHVTGRRPDGYHTLQTAFLLLNHGDELTLTLREDGQIVRTTDLAGVPPEQDLVVRAARLLQAKTGCKLGAEIALTKCLPMGGGLGGGSSNAASVLLGLNQLWALGVSREKLQEWALTLGADVPFFVFGQTAWAEGLGEALKPFSVEKSWFLVVEPPVSVPTAEIFSSKDLTRNTKPINIAPLTSLPDIMSATRNDLEAVTKKLYPQVEKALNILAQFGVARMSGSGACVFLLCENQAHAHEVEKKVAEMLPWRMWVAQSLSEHPLKLFSQN